MIRPIARFTAPAMLSISVTLVVLAGACGTDVTIGRTDEVASAPPSFTAADAEATPLPEAGLTSYCPSSKCPAGYTNCPRSHFPCDVNLLTDRQNCGACGVVCPSDTARERYECIEGRCVLQCGAYPATLDCDGLPDNGCEIDPNTNDHCGDCGTKCLDPNKPCLPRSGGGYECGCRDDQVLCFGLCLDLRRMDAHCGACGNACDPTGDGGVLYPNTYYGCVDSQCGKLKCKVEFGNCDGDLINGCESELSTEENCGSCGNACAPGEECRLDLNARYRCMCPPSKTYCSASALYGDCYDTTSDRRNCGGCGISCGTAYGAIGLCVNGTCKMDCNAGRADCNGNQADGCEVNIDSDPRNCGACGIACDAIAGQACVGGRCVVEPCDEVGVDAGGPK